MCSLREAKEYGTTSEAQAAAYDRNNPAYPYKSHGQWLKASYGMVACTLIVLFNGVEAFLQRPFGTLTFIASYISVSANPTRFAKMRLTFRSFPSL